VAHERPQQNGRGVDASEHSLMLAEGTANLLGGKNLRKWQSGLVKTAATALSKSKLRFGG